MIEPGGSPLPSRTPSCIVTDYLWEHFAEIGSSALNTSQFAQSLNDWQTAGLIARAFDPTDPRRAASLAGHAIAGYATGQLAATEAEHMLKEAASAWHAAQRWVDTMVPELSGRSSLFHFRLERKHASAYQELARRDYHRLAEAGAAACAIHLALVLQDRAPDEAKRLYRRAIAARKAGLGARDLGCLMAMISLHRLVQATGDSASDETNSTAEIAATTHRDPLAPLARWKKEMPTRMSDRRRLLAAVYLSPVFIRR